MNNKERKTEKNGYKYKKAKREKRAKENMYE